MKQTLENLVFSHRKAVVVLFLVLTVVMAWQASHLKIDAGFAKLLPLKHPYMQTFVEYRDAYGGANKVVIAIKAQEGDIFTPEFFEILAEVTDEVFFIPGVDRTRVMSLFTPNVRFTEVVEDGIAGGNVIPADFEPTPEGLARVRENILKSNYMGRLVANDFSAAIIVAELLEVNPDTGEKLDVIEMASQFEGIREKYSADPSRRRLRLPHHRLRQGHRRHRRRRGPGGAVLPHRLHHHRGLRLCLLPELQDDGHRRRLLVDGGDLAARGAHHTRLRDRPHVHPGSVSGLRHRGEPRSSDGQRFPRGGGCGFRQSRGSPLDLPPIARSGRNRAAVRHHRLHHHHAHRDPDDPGNGHHRQPRCRHHHPHRSHPGAGAAVLRPSR